MRTAVTGWSRLPASPGRSSFGLRLWRVVASPWWTISLLLILALPTIPGLFLPQSGSIPDMARAQWLAILQGRYGRWTGLLSNLGLFDVTRALWVQGLLVLLAYQSLVATAEGCVKARQRMHLGGEYPPERPPAFARKREVLHLHSPLRQAVTQVQAIFECMGCRVLSAQADDLAVLEVVRYPWLSLSRPLAHGGVVLVCLAGLLGGRLDWHEGPITLGPGQTSGLLRSPQSTLHLASTGLARKSSQPYSWISLIHDEQIWCEGVVAPGRTLNCRGVSIRQSGTEPALHVAFRDPLGQPLAIQLLRGGEPAAPEIVLHLPYYVPDAYAFLPERGLMLHIEALADQTRPSFRLTVYRGHQSAPLLQRDIAEPTSLTVEGLTLTLDLIRIPSFRMSRRPSWPLRWMGLSVSLIGLLAGLALYSSSLWIQMDERQTEVCLSLWQCFRLPWGLRTLRETESQMVRRSTSGTETCR